MDYSAHLWLSRTMISLDYAFMPRIARLWRNNGRLVGERQQFLKFSQCLSALTAVPAEWEESTPPKWGGGDGAYRQHQHCLPGLVRAGTGMASSLQVYAGPALSCPPPAPLWPLFRL